MRVILSLVKVEWPPFAEIAADLVNRRFSL